METKCIRGRNHGAFVAANDDDYDPKVLDLEEGDVPADWHPGQYGYCSVCLTAMRWDVEAMQLVDWPSGNVVPHCAYCSSAIGEGQHYLVDIQVNIDTFAGPHLQVMSPFAVPPIKDAVTCGPLCLIYLLLNDERMNDVFNR